VRLKLQHFNITAACVTEILTVKNTSSNFSDKLLETVTFAAQYQFCFPPLRFGVPVKNTRTLTFCCGISILLDFLGWCSCKKQMEQQPKRS
jgi:hypothetical protein